MKSGLFSSLMLIAGLAVGLGVAPSAASAAPTIIFSTDFENGVPPEFSGVTTIEPVQGYAGLGTGVNVFGGNFLRNKSTLVGATNVASKTTLTLNNLPPHTSIDLSFLLATIDSWDGYNLCVNSGPDILNVQVDDVIVFKRTFNNSDCNGTDESGPLGFVLDAGVALARYANLGFNTADPVFLDSAYDMGRQNQFKKIPHTSNKLTISWFASSPTWQAGEDESWAIDNVKVSLNGVYTPVTIDMRPGGSQNSVNPKNQGIVQVAVLSNSAFNATNVDPTTLRFENGSLTGAPVHASFRDVNGDRIADLVVHFKTQDTGILCGNTSVTLIGKTYDGLDIKGSDFISTVGCN